MHIGHLNRCPNLFDSSNKRSRNDSSIKLSVIITANPTDANIAVNKSSIIHAPNIFIGDIILQKNVNIIIIYYYQAFYSIHSSSSALSKYALLEHEKSPLRIDSCQNHLNKM